VRSHLLACRCVGFKPPRPQPVNAAGRRITDAEMALRFQPPRPQPAIATCGPYGTPGSGTRRAITVPFQPSRPQPAIVTSGQSRRFRRSIHRFNPRDRSQRSRPATSRRPLRDGSQPGESRFQTARSRIVIATLTLLWPFANSPSFNTRDREQRSRWTRRLPAARPMVVSTRATAVSDRDAQG